jgi:hypothetical protein
MKPGKTQRGGASFNVAPTGPQLPEGARRLLAPEPESDTCTVKLAGKTLADTGAHACTWELDGRARGKRLVAQLAVTYQGATKTVRLADTVARRRAGPAASRAV